MPSQNQRNLLRRRRRLEEDGEDTSSVAEHIDDSQSENSMLSDDDGDADDSDLSETDRPDPAELGIKSNGAVKPHQDAVVLPASTEHSKAPTFAASTDTEAMINGLSLSEDITNEQSLDFDNTEEAKAVQSDAGTGSQSGSKRQENFADRKRREHEEYKKNRDENPAFIPTRGAFFMHDQRSAQAQNGARILGRGRGRGRDTFGSPFSPGNLRSQPPDATKAAWTHDLHDTLHETAAISGLSKHAPTSMPAPSVIGNPRSSTTGNHGFNTVRNYSTTRDMAYTQIRVRLPGMAAPVTYANSLIKQYTKLPDHRPPLRRDKPVRISLAGGTPRYIFPAVDRSFIFIPRALRPNQQGYGRGRSRLGSMGGFSSRRTSVFGGSVYSPSVPVSRRSSFVGPGMASPSGSVRPIVRMPPGSQQRTASGTPVMVSGHGTPVMNQPPMMPMYHPYPPQKPAFRENWPQNMPMHQPRPQKTVSVAGIETPASQFNAQFLQDQAFSHQLPPHVNGAQQDTSHMYPRPPPFQTQATGTPLSNIPERAIHAPSFQPYQQTGYVEPTAYYYPQIPPQYAPGAVIAPMVIQNGQQGSYLVPTIAPAPQPVQSAQQPYEQNGMVFYYDPSQMPYVSQPAEQYNGYGAMMAPMPDGYYYGPAAAGAAPPPVYYQHQ